MSFWERIVNALLMIPLGAAFAYYGFVIGRARERSRCGHIVDLRSIFDQKLNPCCKSALLQSRLEISTGSKTVEIHERIGVSSSDGGKKA